MRYRDREESWQYPLPTLEVDVARTRGKGPAFAQASGMREELTTASFTIDLAVSGRPS